MDKIIVAFVGIGLIGFVLWFFLGKKRNKKVVEANDHIRILVDGGYSPEKIVLKKGQKTALIFDRKDASDCLEEILIPDFKIRKFLPLDQETKIEILPEKVGEFDFECGMGMFKGKLIVKD